MPNTPNPIPGTSQTRAYHIRIKGHLGPRWSEWFEGLTITPEDTGDTVLTGSVVDQAALHGLLRKVRDLGLPLLSIIEADPNQDDAPDDNRQCGKRDETEACV
jgi:hypothetical protein